MKNGLFAPDAITKPQALNNKILQPIIDFGFMSTQHLKKKKNNIYFYKVKLINILVWAVIVKIESLHPLKLYLYALYGVILY